MRAAYEIGLVAANKMNNSVVDLTPQMKMNAIPVNTNVSTRSPPPLG